MVLAPAALAQLALAVAGLSLLVTTVLALRLRRLSRAHRVLVAGDSRASFVQSVERHTAAARAVRADLEQARADLARVRTDVATALRHVAVVRYDAFDDIAGRTSFSAALLDDAGDGVVLSTLNSRREGRTYAKGITAGSSEQPLSPEEQEAVRKARPRR